MEKIEQSALLPTKLTIMKKIILVYGLCAGVVVSIVMLYLTSSITSSEGNIDFDKGMIIGYASMIIAFSLVFVGIRNYRNNCNGGVISFGKSFKIGMLIVLIASTIYVVSWLIYYFFFVPDFAEKYAIHMIENLKASGASQIEIDQQTAEMASFARSYKNPLFNAMLTYIEILPVGLIVTLISAFILKRKVVKD